MIASPGIRPIPDPEALPKCNKKQPLDENKFFDLIPCVFIKLEHFKGLQFW
jgi:hypothetical protein